MHHPRSASESDVPSALVRAELDRILASDVFFRSDRLSAFLHFIVEQTLAGRGDSLKEHVIAVELYGKSTDFNTAADPIVRVDARRLRDKLREYYASAPDDAILVSVPKGTYTPVFETNGFAVPRSAAATASQPATASVTGPWSRSRVAIGGLLLTGLTGLVIGLVWHMRSQPSPLRFFTVTAFPGWEGHPAISPDGNVVAFARTGPDTSAPNDLWVKAVDGDALLRLTNTPDLHEVGPAWSSDGREIAFMALAAAETTTSRGVFVISAVGGEPTRVADGGGPTWIPSTRSLIVNDRANGTLALFRHDIDTGSRRQLTWPSEGFSDVMPAVSPDASTVAFARFSRRGAKVAFFLVPTAGGEPVRRTEWAEPTAGLTWTPDSRELLYSSADSSGVRMYRISAAGTEPGRLISELPITASAPSVSRPRAGGTFRLAFVSGFADVGLRLIDLHAAAHARIDAAQQFCDSARMDTPGRFSRDGAQVAFASNRGGSPQVWVANRDGSALRRLTELGAASVNVGSWSPDGRQVVFDAVVNGNADIYVASTDASLPRRLTSATATESDPEWSRDGRWIYYVSDASGRSEIWRMPAEGGKSFVLTTGGAYEPREAPDGQSLYYVDRARRSEGLGASVTLKQVPVAGGEARTVFAGVRGGTWDVTDGGVTFLTTDSMNTVTGHQGDALACYRFAEQRVVRLAALPFMVARYKTPRLAASSDGRWVLVNHLDAWERDVMVADDFR
jgi:Tol biopolymer transport system component